MNKRYLGQGVRSRSGGHVPNATGPPDLTLRPERGQHAPTGFGPSSVTSVPVPAVHESQCNEAGHDREPIRTGRLFQGGLGTRVRHPLHGPRNVAVHCVASSTNVTTRRPIRGDSTLKVMTKLPLESKSTKLSPIKVGAGPPDHPRRSFRFRLE